ncbi:MAG: UDP-glucose/GDP-mannose dehydrogenase family protein [Alphaproteobacteria bacterium]|jgi:UDPglucose 6-dehydrogenase|nr:UDP-glucose/GDP-mannose dehydrogenase family protein [Alphaproteobacteria bacterium]
MKIAIIGTGYVGLPTGVGFAELGHNVVCIDKDIKKIKSLQAGKITLFEKGLEELLQSNIASGRLSFTDSMADGLLDAEVVILAVGTPMDDATGQADLTYIYAATKELAPHIKKYTVIATKSTVPVGTGDTIEKIIQEINPHANCDVVSLPEFLREGFAVYDFFHPDRVVVGTDSVRARNVITNLYSVYENIPKLFFTDRRSSELIKYVSNAFLSVKIHFINEIADMCELIGANIYDVAAGMGMDTRIGNKFLNPGPGFGGSCFPKDTKALQFIANHCGANLSLVDATILGNDDRIKRIANRIITSIDGVKNPKIAVWGLAFKAGTDDIRKSPAIDIIHELLAYGAAICAYDPKAIETTREELQDTISYASNAQEATQNADILVVLTEWSEFRAVKLNELNMKSKIIMDMRNIINREDATKAGFKIQTIGLTK